VSRTSDEPDFAFIAPEYLARSGATIDGAMPVPAFAAVRSVRIAVALAGLLLVMTLQAASAGAASSPLAGGVYKVGLAGSNLGFTDSFDPTGEYSYGALGIYSNLMLRTLVGYDHVAGPPGNQLVPDLATTVPAPTDGGRTYTFHLRPGVRFGPPVGRAVTSRDVLYALERLANPKNGGQYAFYYTVIRGWDAFANGEARSISGIETPDASTIVFHLTRPTPDFLYRLAMPATAPIPHEVARCFTGASAYKYGGVVVSTGPYMLDGIGSVHLRPCSGIQPAAGFNSGQVESANEMVLVRNPDYDPKTDSRAAREALPDEFDFVAYDTVSGFSGQVQSGRIDDLLVPSLPAPVIQQWHDDPALNPRLHLNPNDAEQFIPMNLTQPPFDDVHVRRALNWVMDKAALQQAWGGPLAGSVSTHVVPDTMLDLRLEGYDPYRTPGGRGSIAKAKAAMRGSKYDTAHNGMCGAPQCKHVVLLAGNEALDDALVPVILRSAKKIGITFKVRALGAAYPVLQTPANNVPIAEFPGWAKDYADPSTFLDPLFDGRGIATRGNTNYSLVGITPATAKRVGVTGSVAGVPSADGRLDRCAALSGRQRLSCYAQLDRYLMTTIVPWVPYRATFAEDITSAAVTKWGFDQFSGTTAWAHVAVKKQKP
jgi:peptide/nickel transport system substrate-binding protein